jgi:SAM-dependent methyltransferase
LTGLLGESMSEGAARLHLYSDLADWWPLLSAPEEYAEEAAFYWRTLTDACGQAPATVLELGSGGGNNASHLKHKTHLTLVDRSPAMLAVSRRLNPECEHLQGDMRTLRLDRQFEAVFIHDAIAYMASEADLRSALATAFFHCRPGGAALFAPDATRETFRPLTDHGGHDGDRRSLRYLEWTWLDAPPATTYTLCMVYVLREADQPVREILERHVCGLFGQGQWLELMRQVGFEARVIPFEHSEVTPGSSHVFLGRKPPTIARQGARP